MSVSRNLYFGAVRMIRVGVPDNRSQHVDVVLVNCNSCSFRNATGSYPTVFRRPCTWINDTTQISFDRKAARSIYDTDYQFPHTVNDE